MAARYVVGRVDLSHPIALILFGWLLALAPVGRRDRRVLVTKNDEGRLVVLGEGTDSY